MDPGSNTEFSKELAAFNPRPPLSASQIADWERIRRVALPEDMLRFYSQMNGTAPADDEVALWPLEKVEPLAIAAPAYAHQGDEFFVFADYLIWSHGYAVRLLSSGRVTRPVFLIGGDRPWQVADSFSSFVTALAAGQVPQ